MINIYDRYRDNQNDVQIQRCVLVKMGFAARVISLAVKTIHSLSIGFIFKSHISTLGRFNPVLCILLLTAFSCNFSTYFGDKTFT